MKHNGTCLTVSSLCTCCSAECPMCSVVVVAGQAPPVMPTWDLHKVDNWDTRQRVRVLRAISTTPSYFALVVADTSPVHPIGEQSGGASARRPARWCHQQTARVQRYSPFAQSRR